MKRKREKTLEDKKIEIMRRATTDAENVRGIGGREKDGGRAPRPIALVKMPWDEEKRA